MSDGTYGELIFGENPGEDILSLYSKLSERTITQPEAQELLNAIQHPELKKAVDYFESQIQQNERKITYDNSKPYLDSLIFGLDLTQNLLFTDWSYHTGFFSKFCNLLEARFPEYKRSREKLELGQIVLEQV